MTTQHENTNDEVTEQELEKLDANLLEIEILFKSRCVQAPAGRNVTVREVETKE